MAAITTVATAGAGATVKGALLTNAEVDANLLNINDELFVDALPVVRPSLLLDFLNQDALDSRVTFARASTATYYDGRTVAKAEQNLLPSAGDLSSWGGGSLTITGAATTAPDGSNTGARITVPANSSGSFGLAHSTLVLSAGTYTFSVYVKADSGVTWVFLRFDQGNDRVASFNLSTGTVGTVHADYASAAMTSVGNGWFRCSVTRNSAGNWSNSFYFYFGPASADATSGWSSSPTNSSFFAWGAQLDQRASPGLFVPATTHMPRLVTAPAGVPRFAFDPSTGEPLGLLVEEQRTNLLTYSEQFDGAAWTQDSGAVIVPDQAVAPNGTLTADLLRGSATYGYHWVLASLFVSAGASYTLSVYAKAAGYNWLRLADASGGGQLGLAYFNLQNGTVGTVSSGVSATITHVGNNWYRCVISGSSPDVAFGPSISFSNADNTSIFTDNGVGGIYIWGAQLEAGAFATSYIPTAAAQVTRSADQPAMTGANFSGWYRQDEGTIVIQARRLASNADLAIVAGTGNLNTQSSVYFLLIANGNTRFQNGGGVDIVGGAPGADVKTAAVAYKVNDNCFVLNGSVVGTDLSSSQMPADKLSLGGEFPIAANCGLIQRLSYYPKRLSNTELRALTL